MSQRVVPDDPDARFRTGNPHDNSRRATNLRHLVAVRSSSVTRRTWYRLGSHPSLREAAPLVLAAHRLPPLPAVAQHRRQEAIGVGEKRVARADEPGADALATFVASTGPWTRVQAPLAPRLSAALRLIALANLVVGGWAATVLAAGWSCSWSLCELSTMGDRPTLLLGLTAGSVLVTALLAVVTGGLVRAGGGQLAALTLSAVVGVVAVAGAVLALVLIVVAVGAALAFLLALIERL